MKEGGGHMVKVVEAFALLTGKGFGACMQMQGAGLEEERVIPEGVVNA